MLKYCIKRLLWMIPVVLGVAILTFTLMYFVPGDPTSTILGVDATQEDREAMRQQLGLDDPDIIRLGRFLKESFLEFDLGTSYKTKQDVGQQIIEKLPEIGEIDTSNGTLSKLLSEYVEYVKQYDESVKQLEGTPNKSGLVFAAQNKRI